MGDTLYRPDQITIVAVSTATFILGVLISSLVFFNKDTVLGTVNIGSRPHPITVKSVSPDYMPSIVLCLVAICFTGGIGYVITNQVYSDNLEASKNGIKSAIGLAWGLFVIAAILIPASLSSAKISVDSKYYLLAAMFTFYFSTVVAIIVFFNKLHTLPNSLDQLDLKTTQNVQMGLFIGTVAYGIAAITYV